MPRPYRKRVAAKPASKALIVPEPPVIHAQVRRTFEPLPGYPKTPNPHALDRIHPSTGKRYTSDAARIGDGLPQNGELFAAMTQHARDAILSVAFPPKKFDK